MGRSRGNVELFDWQEKSLIGLVEQWCSKGHDRRRFMLKTTSSTTLSWSQSRFHWPITSLHTNDDGQSRNHSSWSAQHCQWLKLTGRTPIALEETDVANHSLPRYSAHPDLQEAIRDYPERRNEKNSLRRISYIPLFWSECCQWCSGFTQLRKGRVEIGFTSWMTS